MRRYAWLIFAVAVVALAAWMLRWNVLPNEPGNILKRVNRFNGDVEWYDRPNGRWRDMSER